MHGTYYSLICFDRLPGRDVVTWNAIISGYVEMARGVDELCLVEQMNANGIIPNAQTFVYILHACGSIGNCIKPKDLHSSLVKRGLEEEMSVINTVMGTYVKGGMLLEAQDVFDEFSCPDIVSHCTLLGGYADYGHHDKALHCLRQVQGSAVYPNVFMYVCGLKFCGNAGMLIDGHNLHSELVNQGLEKDPIIGSSLVDMYAKCGLLKESQGVFDKLVARDVVSWTALMVGYITSGCGDKAICCFNHMQEDMVDVNVITYVCTLNEGLC